MRRDGYCRFAVTTVRFCWTIWKWSDMSSIYNIAFVAWKTFKNIRSGFLSFKYYFRFNPFVFLKFYKNILVWTSRKAYSNLISGFIVLRNKCVLKLNWSSTWDLFSLFIMPGKGKFKNTWLEEDQWLETLASKKRRVYRYLHIV